MEQPSTPPVDPPKPQAQLILAMVFGFLTTALCLVLLALEKKLGFEDGTHTAIVATLTGGTLVGAVGAFKFQGPK